MNIVHIITGLSTGGAENTLYNLLRSSLGEQHENHVISLGGIGTVGTKIRELNVPVITLNITGSTSALLGMKKLRRTIKELNPDLIQGWLSHGNLVAILAKKFAPNKTALVWNTRHSLLNTHDTKWSTRQVIRLCRYISSKPDLCIYNSELAKKQHEEFGFSSQCAVTIPNGIDIETFSYSATAKEEIHLELDIPTNSFVVGHVARAHPMKDHPTFLRAASIVANKHKGSHFILVGLGADSGNEKLEKHIDLNVRKRFHLIGERDDVPNLMSAMDLFCQSSWSEGFPNVLGEAMATSIPCVATNVGDTNVILGECGFVIPPKNVQALGDAMDKLIRMREKDRFDMGQHARKRIETNFTIKSMTARYLEAYEKVLQDQTE